MRRTHHVDETHGPLQERLRWCAERLRSSCECDGRGCYVCIAIDLMVDAADAIEQDIDQLHDALKVEVRR